MEQLLITLEPENYKLVADYSLHIYNSNEEVINSTLNIFDGKVSKQQLVTSAELYLEEYHKNNEIHDLTESALFDYID